MRQLFEVKDYKTTKEKHAGRMNALANRMEEKELGYDDILGSDAFITIETQAHEKWSMWKSMEMSHLNERRIAQLINYLTRQVIVNSLEYWEIPKSYDTAFFMLYYEQTIEEMSAIVQNFKDRGEL